MIETVRKVTIISQLSTIISQLSFKINLLKLKELWQEQLRIQ